MSGFRKIFRVPGLFERRLGSTGLLILLKLVTMAGALVSVQLTASLFSGESFLLLNSILFIIAIHGCLTYSIQVSTWSQGGIDLTSYLYVQIVTILVSLIFTVIYKGDWYIMAATILYTAYRSNERVLFNLQITRSRIVSAYGIMLIALAVEIALALVGYFFVGRGADRFILPSLGALAVTVPIILALIKRGGSFFPHALKSNKRHMLYMSAHAGFIAVNIMSDRLIFSSRFSQIDENIHDYLLIFSYCSSGYALAVSILEVERPKLFQLKSTSLSEFLIKGRYVRFIVSSAIVALSSCAAILIIVQMAGSILGIAEDAPAKLFAILLSIFFLGQVWLAYIHIYFISKNLYGILFATWAISAGVRFVGFLQPEWVGFLAISTFSGFAAIIFSLLIARVYRL